MNTDQKERPVIVNIRITENVDLHTFETLYGLQIDQGQGWAHVIEDGQFLMKSDRSEVEQIRADLLGGKS
ncbi:hypothetical protein [Epibacterium ulvae]|uniref:hypothetical protein n=1 Tax=Epibacterium ulvae TaxID=1156985 RepID=UPI002490D351|nr:hypothetical protein [Epibacterium ulvae]